MTFKLPSLKTVVLSYFEVLAIFMFPFRLKSYGSVSSMIFVAAIFSMGLIVGGTSTSYTDVIEKSSMLKDNLVESMLNSRMSFAAIIYKTISNENVVASILTIPIWCSLYFMFWYMPVFVVGIAFSGMMFGLLLGKFLSLLLARVLSVLIIAYPVWLIYQWMAK